MSKIKSMTRDTLLLQPWLTYSQVRLRIEPHVGKVAIGTVGVYGSEIRPEIGRPSVGPLPAVPPLFCLLPARSQQFPVHPCGVDGAGLGG